MASVDENSQTQNGARPQMTSEFQSRRCRSLVDRRPDGGDARARGVAVRAERRRAAKRAVKWSAMCEVSAAEARAER